MLPNLNEQVQSVAREDIQDYLATWQRPDAAILGIVGMPPTPFPHKQKQPFRPVHCTVCMLEG